MLAPGLQERALVNSLLMRFVADESGTTAIEYALIGSIVSILIVAGAMTIGTKLNTTLADIAPFMK